jgi:CDP-diacylglycerol--glycerol-3-phosphate 3-phosphatidyltransferase
MKKSQIITASNLLSFLRIFLAIPIFYYIAHDDKSILLLIIFIAILTDFLDGYFARKFDEITELGKILDPFADKVCTTAGFVALTLYQGFPLWLTTLIILRDVFILLGSFIILKKEKIITSSNIPGKVTVFFISLLAIIHILEWQILFTPVIILTIISIVISAYNYLLVLFRSMNSKSNE